MLFHETEKVWCNDCKKLVEPQREKYIYGADADGNRGEERIDFTCPECDGDDLDSNFSICDSCSEPKESNGEDYCRACIDECKDLISKFYQALSLGMTFEIKDVQMDSELIEVAKEEMQ